MPLDPALLKLRWGVTDPALEPLVEMVAAQAQALAEAYCGRMFDHGPDEEDFNRVNYSFQVRRYPITKITALHGWTAGQLPGEPSAAPEITAFQMDAGKGLVWPGGRFGAQVHIAYEGGFATWPIDLQWAVTQAADIIWTDTPGGGAPAGSAGGASLGPIKRISVVGVYSAEIGETGSGGDGASDGWGVLPPEVTDVLDRYRLAAVVGIG